MEKVIGIKEWEIGDGRKDLLCPIDSFVCLQELATGS